MFDVKEEKMEETDALNAVDAISYESLPQLFRELPKRYVLPNGLTVLHREDPQAEVVSVQVWVKTGSIHEGALLGAGLSHYLEHLLFRGTKKRADGSIAREVQEKGGYINAYTTFDRTVYYVDLPAEGMAFGVELLSDMVFNSVLSDETIETEREVILREIAMGLDDPDRKVSRALFHSVFRAHPYGHPVIGYEDLFKGVEAEELRRYYKERYVPSNMVISIVGAVSEVRVREAIDLHFGQVAMSRTVPAMIPREPAQYSFRESRLTGDVTICRGSMAFQVPGLAHVDAPGLDVLAVILGQGHSSLLWQLLREERQLVHSVSSSLWNPGDMGLFWIGYTCDPGKRVEVEAAILEAIKSIGQIGCSQAELNKARRFALVDEINARKTMSGQASQLGFAETVIGDVGYTGAYFRRLEQVEIATVSQLVNQYLTRDNLTASSLNTMEAEAKVQASATQVKPERPLFQLKTLSNGARLLWQCDPHLPKVHLRLAGLGGCLYEASDGRGVTSLMSTLLTKDTEWRSAREVAEWIESVGGQFTEFSGNNSFGISMEVLANDLDRGIQLLEEGVLNATFDEGTFDRERNARIAEIQEHWDDIADRGRLLLRKAFFGEHPLGIDAEGTLETLKQLHVDDVRAIAERLIVGPNMVLVIAGDFEAERVLPQLESFLEDLPEWHAREVNTGSVVHEKKDIRETMDREQSVVFLAFPDVGVRDDAHMVSNLIHAVCGDMASELFRKVRDDRGLAYYVSTDRVSGLDTGCFSFYAGTRPEAAEEVLTVLREEAERLRSGGMTAAELARGQTRLKSNKKMRLQSIGARAGQTGMRALLGLSINDWIDFDQRVDAIQLEDVKRFAETHFVDDKAVSLIIGPDVVK